MTPQDVLSQICLHEVEINEHANNLVRIKQFFNGNELWPDQCEFAISIFAKALKPIQSLNKLLDATPSFPSDLAVNRYSLLVQSHYIEKTIIDIVKRLEAYKGLCKSGLKHNNQRYIEIVDDLENLWKSYEHLTYAVDSVIANSPLKTSYIS